MCANVDLDATKQFVKKHNGQKQIRVYKYLTLFDYMISEKRLISPYRYTEYKPGVIKSNSKAKLQTKHNREINRGIHTFINKKDAEYEANMIGDECVVAFTADIKDLICIGTDGEAVWRKVTLSKSAYKKAIGNE